MRNLPKTGISMTSLRRIGLGFAFAVAAAFAAEAQNQQNPVTQTQTTGSWTVRCYRMQGAPCDITQTTIDRNRRVLVSSVSIAYVAKQNAYVGRFMLPLGVSFDQGMSLEIGSFRAANLKFKVCEREGCLVTGLLPQSLIDAMQSGGSGKGTMSAAFVDGHKFQIPIELDGFSDGLDVLKKFSSGGDKDSKK
jgi:invasion protein IalB